MCGSLATSFAVLLAVSLLAARCSYKALFWEHGVWQDFRGVFSLEDPVTWGSNVNCSPSSSDGWPSTGLSKSLADDMKRVSTGNDWLGLVRQEGEYRIEQRLS